MQRRFVVTNLAPSSVYQLKVEAHNVAGSNQAEFTFVTLTKEGGKSADKSDWQSCCAIIVLGIELNSCRSFVSKIDLFRREDERIP